jgi:hypothetical protein
MTSAEARFLNAPAETDDQCAEAAQLYDEQIDNARRKNEGDCTDFFR